MEQLHGLGNSRFGLRRLTVCSVIDALVDRRFIPGDGVDGGGRDRGSASGTRHLVQHANDGGREGDKPEVGKPET